MRSWIEFLAAFLMVIAVAVGAGLYAAIRLPLIAIIVGTVLDMGLLALMVATGPKQGDPAAIRVFCILATLVAPVVAWESYLLITLGILHR
jgi:hypothetical protein